MQASGGNHAVRKGFGGRSRRVARQRASDDSEWGSSDVILCGGIIDIAADVEGVPKEDYQHCVWPFYGFGVRQSRINGYHIAHVRALVTLASIDHAGR
jgi:hypothetical protein